MKNKKFASIEQLREYLCERGYEDSVVFESPDYCEAVVGVSDDGRVIYSYEGMIASLMDHDAMNYDEAMEFVDYNTVRSLPYAGSSAPIVMYGIDDL